ncbi:dCTP deaminase [Buchnera aphidicola]|uniref:dCTP deaminase n=1 Tax=Buchnera aphidicola TaxID=9 RepID=UPI0031B88EE7
MRLCDKDIKLWMKLNKIIIYPFPKKKNIHGITVDLKLGNEFRILNEYKVNFIDLGDSRKNINKKFKKLISKKILIKEKNIFLLQPGSFALGITLENVKIPDTLVGWIDGKSSLARLGLMIHVTSHRIDPGWKGKIVLEFFNAGKVALGLRPGMLIAAISFETLSNKVSIPYNYRKKKKYYKQEEIYEEK